MNRFLEIFNVITVVVLVLLVVGAAEVVTDDMTFREYVETFDWIITGTAIGRGIASLGRVD